MIEVSNPASGLPSPFVAVFYQASTIAKKDEVPFHGNATQAIFSDVQRCFAKVGEKCVNGINA